MLQNLRKAPQVFLQNRGKDFWNRSAISEMTLLYIAKNITSVQILCSRNAKTADMLEKTTTTTTTTTKHTKKQKNAYASDDSTF